MMYGGGGGGGGGWLFFIECSYFYSPTYYLCVFVLIFPKPKVTEVQIQEG